MADPDTAHPVTEVPPRPDPCRRGAEWALVWALPLYPLVPRFEVIGPLGTDDFIPVACLGLVTWELMRARMGPRAMAPVLRVLGLFVAVATLAALLAAESWLGAAVATLRVSARFAMYAVALVAVSRLLTAAHRRRLLAMIVCVAVFEGLFGITTYVGKVHAPMQMGMLSYPPEAMPPGGRVRVQGTFGGAVPLGETYLNRANFYSAYLVMGLMALGPFLDRRRRWPLLVLAALAILGGILASYSRMSLLAALFGTVLLAGLSRRWLMVAAVGVACVGALASSDSLRHRFSQFGSDRIEQWTIATRVIQAHPVLGVGDSAYLKEAIRLSPGIEVAKVRTPHNSVLYASASHGVAAGCALVALYLLLMVRAFRSWRASPGPVTATQLAIVAAFVLHDLTNNLFFVPEVALAFWLVYGATDGEVADAGPAPLHSG